MDREQEKLLLFLATVLAAVQANSENSPPLEEQGNSEENPPTLEEQAKNSPILEEQGNSEENPPTLEEQAKNSPILEEQANCEENPTTTKEPQSTNRKRPVQINLSDGDSDDPNSEPQPTKRKGPIQINPTDGDSDDPNYEPPTREPQPTKRKGPIQINPTDGDSDDPNYEPPTREPQPTKRKGPIQINPTDGDSDDPNYEPPHKVPGRQRRYLNIHEYPQIEEHITNIEKFCCDPMNLMRQGDAIKAETWRKTKIHLLLFFTYLVENQLDPSLDQLENRTTVEGFLKWIQKERELQPGTISTYIDHLLTGLRYVYATKDRDYKQESMTRWLSRRRDELHKETTVSTSHHSWQSLEKNKGWISW